MIIKYSNKWQPVNEDGKITTGDFDKRFELDRIYIFNGFFYKTRIRFVKYPEYNNITVYITKIPKIPKSWHAWLDKNISSFITQKIWNSSCKSYEAVVTRDELYFIYGYGY